MGLMTAHPGRRDQICGGPDAERALHEAAAELIVSNHAGNTETASDKSVE